MARRPEYWNILKRGSYWGSWLEVFTVSFVPWISSELPRFHFSHKNTEINRTHTQYYVIIMYICIYVIICIYLIILSMCVCTHILYTKTYLGGKWQVSHQQSLSQVMRRSFRRSQRVSLVGRFRADGWPWIQVEDADFFNAPKWYMNIDIDKLWYTLYLNIDIDIL